MRMTTTMMDGGNDTVKQGQSKQAVTNHWGVVTIISHPECFADRTL
jgi:hypothetical protein